MLPTRNSLQLQRYTYAQSEGIIKDIPCEWKPKQAVVAILTSDNINFNSKAVTRDKESHCIIIRSFNQGDIVIINIYTLNTGIPKYIKQILTDLNEGRDNNTI